MSHCNHEKEVSSYCADCRVGELLNENKQLRKALTEIRDYEAYSWNNDRAFIDSRIKGVSNLLTT